MDTTPELVTLKPETGIAIREKVPLAKLPAFFGAAFGELAACAGGEVAGPPLARYFAFEPAGVDVEAIFPLRAPVAVTGRIHAVALPGGPAVQVRHVGSYDELGRTYQSIEEWIDDHHEKRADAVREVYLSMPTAPVDERVTLVVQPLQT
jgi:effector-binding domain-containing protein